jgi:hypothetical protein
MNYLFLRLLACGTKNSLREMPIRLQLNTCSSHVGGDQNNQLAGRWSVDDLLPECLMNDDDS